MINMKEMKELFSSLITEIQGLRADIQILTATIEKEQPKIVLENSLHEKIRERLQQRTTAIGIPLDGSQVVMQPSSWVDGDGPSLVRQSPEGNSAQSE